MRKILISLVFILMAVSVLAVCETNNGTVTKNGVSFPSYCADESTLLIYSCENGTLTENYQVCGSCYDDVCSSEIIDQGNNLKNQTVEVNNTYIIPVTNETVNPDTNETEIVTPCEDEWNCGTWSSCVNSKQQRTCEKLNDCKENGNKPVEEQTCSIPVGSSITKIWIEVGIIIVIIIVVIVWITSLIRKHDKRREEEW